MADHSAIEWCDSTFNPWIGCTKISPACDHCYAAVSTPARTLGITWGAGQPRRRTAAAGWKLPLRWNRDRSAFFAEHGRRRRVFCASLADVFDNEVDPTWRADLLRLVAATPNLDWLLLTKRIGNATKLIAEVADLPRPASHEGHLLAHHWRNGTPPPNLWLGATICNQAEADSDIPKVLHVPAAVRFLSMEPLLGPVDIARYLVPQCDHGSIPGPPGSGVMCPRCQGFGGCRGIDWVIAGGESGPGARPAHPDWFRSLRDQCADAGVPFLFKQWGEWRPATDAVEATSHPTLVSNRGKLQPSDPARNTIVASGCFHMLHQVLSKVDGVGDLAHLDCAMYRAGKKRAGRLLDGMGHNAWPVVPHG